MKELFKMVIDESDDLNFISIVNKIITATSLGKSYETVHITKVRNWFDHKWLNYSGKEVVQFESDGLVNDDLALKSNWKEQITFPPFNPNRILSSRIYPINRDVTKEELKPLHKYQVSGENLQNRVELKLENTLFSWFSSNSIINKRGSLMVYELLGRKVSTWYCQIEQRENWEIGKVKNISRQELIKTIK